MSLRPVTIRTRLTLLYGALVLLTGAVLLGGILLVLDRVIATQPMVPVLSAQGLRTGPSPSSSGVDSGEDLAQAKRAAAEATESIRKDLRDRTLVPLIRPSLVGLGALGLASWGIGWFVAGRALRPVRAITATAQRVASGTLDARINAQGPPDELRELADTFDAMIDRLDRSFAGQRAFVGNASHELRTPVAISRTLLDVALSDPAAPPELRAVGAQLLEVNARQGRLIEGLLMLARSGHGIDAPQPVDLSRISEGVVDRCREEAVRRGVSVHSGTGQPVRALGDPLLLERLVENLVQNGVRHNLPAAGSLSLAVLEDAGRAVVRVTNTGPTVSADNVSQLFEPFRRATDRVDTHEGAGLGLSIVRAIADLHRGRVVAAANAGGGLTVEVSLPLA